MYDANIHLIDGGLHLASVQLRDAASKAEFVRRIGEYAAARRARRQGLDHGRGLGPHGVGRACRKPVARSRAWIDAVTGDVPVWISRLDGHMALGEHGGDEGGGRGR